MGGFGLGGTGGRDEMVTLYLVERVAPAAATGGTCWPVCRLTC